MTQTSRTTRDTLTAAAKLLGLESQFRLVAPHRFQEILERIVASRTLLGKRGISALWWWEHLREPVSSVRPEDAIATLKTLVGAQEKVWFVAEESSTGKRIGNFWIYEATVETVCCVLQEMPFFEYYVVSKKLDWLVCENHHGYLIANGEEMVAKMRRLPNSE